MGPSVKFVSPNKGLISKKKFGVNFFRRKNDQTGGRGGPRGVWQKTILFPNFFLNPSLIEKISEFPIGHAAKLFPMLHWFQNCFCFRSKTFTLHVGACGRGRRTKIWFGDNFWLRCSIHLRSAHLNCIMDDLFRDTPYWPYLVRQIRQIWPNTVIGARIWANQIWLGGVSLKRSINKQLRQWNSCWCL